MRKDILKILRYASKLGFEVIVYTNGSLIDARSASALGKIRLNKIDITLPGWTDEVFDGVSGVKGSRRKVYQAVELLRKNRVPVEFKTCLLEDNRHEEAKIAAFAKSCGARLRMSDKLDMKLGENGVASHQSPDTRQRRILACGAGRTQIALSPAGEMKMCVLSDVKKIPVFKKSPVLAWREISAWASSKDAAARSCPACLLS